MRTPLPGCPSHLINTFVEAIDQAGMRFTGDLPAVSLAARASIESG